MKRLVALLYIGCFASVVCFVVESEVGPTKNVSQPPDYTINPYHGFDYVIDLAVLTSETFMVRDYSFAFVVDGKSPETAYKSLPVPACRSPGGLPNRF